MKQKMAKKKIEEEIVKATEETVTTNNPEVPTVNYDGPQEPAINITAK